MSDSSTPTSGSEPPIEHCILGVDPGDPAAVPALFVIEHLDSDGRWKRLDRMEPGVRYVVRSVRGRTIGAQS